LALGAVGIAVHSNSISRTRVLAQRRLPLASILQGAHVASAFSSLNDIDTFPRLAVEWDAKAVITKPDATRRGGCDVVSGTCL
jgi:hypothetical protein